MSSNFLQALAGTHLYPITDRVLSGLSHAAQVAQLNDGGATLIQLREKLATPLKFYTEAEAAMRVARERGVTIVINDRVDIALAVKADGVHLGQEDLAPTLARRILGPDAIIGFSTHNLEQAQLAAQLPVDYVAIGPIFSTSTKESSNNPVGLKGLERAHQILGNIPLVAIGGITRKNMTSALGAGAAACALISDIWQSEIEPSKRIRELLSLA
jgi:thiamine-phosphate pyrophosphorylase